MSALRSAPLRLRTALRKFAKWLSPLPVKVLTSLPSGSNNEVPRDKPLAPLENPPVFEAEWRGLQSACLRDDGAVTKIEDTDLRVGRLAGVGVSQASAVTEHCASKSREAQPPTTDVQ